MSAFTSPLNVSLASHDTFRIFVAFASLAIAYLFAVSVYDVFFGPLAKFPGPLLYAFTKLPQMSLTAKGEDNTAIPELHRKYGPIVRISPNELSFAGGSQAFQEIYGFRKHGQPKPFKDPWFYGRPFNKVDGPITADDATHTRQRKILTHAFSDKGLKEQEPMLKQWATKMVSKLKEHAVPGETVDMLKYYNCTTFDIMGQLTFSEGLDMLENSEYSPWVKTIFASVKAGTFFRVLKAYNSVTRYLVQEFLTNSRTVATKQAQHFDYSKQRVDRRLARTPDTPDLWTKILEKSDGPDGLSIGEHHSIASLFMLAGTETTATALSGTTYHLLRNPQCLAKLTAEIRGAFNSLEDFHFDALARQEYLMAVLHEGLRMYPPVPISLLRVVPEAGMTVMGEWIPAGTRIGAHHMATYRSESNFKHADEFHPERWLRSPEFKDDHLDALEPFSVGPRNCLGKNLAWHEMRLLLAAVVLNFELELRQESNDWSDQKVYTLWEKKPLICSLTPAKSAAV